MHVPPFSLSQQIAELGAELDTAVLRVLHSGQYIGGSEIQAFEKDFAARLNVPHVMGCNSGTDALILALRALGVGPGDEVITSSFSFFATAEAISAVGAKPVFVDVEPNTYLINIGQIEDAITPATRALMPVHLFGRPVDMAQVMDLADQYGLKVVEDCAQATGASVHGRAVGSWGDVGCFSFFPTKNLGAAGDAGAVTSHNSNLIQVMRELAVHGMPRRYLHTQLGYNSRLDAIQAAVLNVKLPRLSMWIKQRESIAARYQQLLEGLNGLILPDPGFDSIISHGWNQFVVRVQSINTSEAQSRRDWLKQKLQDKGVNTIIYYPIPIHLQPAYQHLGYSQGSLPITEQLCNEVLSLPIFPELGLEDQQHVVSMVLQLMSEASPAQAQDRVVA